MLLLTNLATNIGSEFLGHIAGRIQHDVGAPILSVFPNVRWFCGWYVFEIPAATTLPTISE